MRRDVDQGLGPDDGRVRPALLDRPRRGDRGADQLVLEPASFARARRAGNSRRRPPSDRKLISFSGQTSGGRPADRLLHLERGQREIGEPLGEIGRGLVDMIGRAVVEQVPDDLTPDLLGRLERRQPARPVVFARRLLDQVPAQPVAEGVESQARWHCR